MDKFSAQETEILIRAGDYCLSSKLFVGLDQRRWELYRGHALMMARMLVKYREVLEQQFEEIGVILDRAPKAPVIRVVHSSNSYGNTAIFEAPYIPKEKFNTYKDTLKRFGLWFDGETKNWFVPAKNMQSTNFNALFEKICDMNFEVSESYSEDWIAE
jgi:hypothetical protein